MNAPQLPVAGAAVECAPHRRDDLHPAPAPGIRAVRRSARDPSIWTGSSNQLIEKILDAQQALGIDRFLAQIDWCGLPKAAAEDSLNRYATEIASAIRATVTTSV